MRRARYVTHRVLICCIKLNALRVLQIWSCGTNDNGALGRVTVMIPDPKDDRAAIEVDEKTKDPVWKPVPIHSLVEEGYRAVKIVAGDSFSAAISDKGELRAWGAFSVRIHSPFFTFPHAENDLMP